MSNVMVRYVGSKESRADTVAGTGIVWTGNGDIQPVPAAKWPLLAKHPDVWELVLEDERQPGAGGSKSLADADKRDPKGKAKAEA